MLLLFSDEVTARLGKSCSFGLPRVSFVIFCQLMYTSFPFSFAGGIWDLISVDLHKLKHRWLVYHGCFEHVL